MNAAGFVAVGAVRPDAAHDDMGMVPHDIARSAYVSLVTYRRDGSPVATPVRAVADAGVLLIWTSLDSWKVKRLRRDRRVTVAPCDLRGRIAAGARVVPWKALLLESSADLARLRAAMTRRYRWRFRLVDRAQTLRYRGSLHHIGLAVTF